MDQCHGSGAGEVRTLQTTRKGEVVFPLREDLCSWSFHCPP